MAGGILVVVENNGKQINRMAWEALAAAQKIGADLGLGISAVVPGKTVGALAKEIAAKAVDKVYTLEDAKLEPYTPDGFAHALKATIEKLQPEFVFFGHSYQVRDYAPKLAAMLGTHMLADCIAAKVQDGKPVFTRQVFAGKMVADYSFAAGKPHLVSFQAGSYNADTLQSGHGAVEALPVNLAAVEIRTKVLEIFQGVKQEVDLSKAEVIISAGRGLKEKENLNLVFDLAKALGGEVSASRPVCDDGWLPVDRQIGSSGQTVAPKLYFAVGISGAIQHVVGMKGSKYIVAVNKDPHAPIFEIADVAVVADLFEVLPPLIKAVQEARAA